MLERKMRILLVVPCMLALMVSAAWATSPYDMPYAVQWNFIIGDAAKNEFDETVTESPDGTVWMATRGHRAYWGNPDSSFPFSNGVAGYGQITPTGKILQGNDIHMVPGISNCTYAYSPHVRFAAGDTSGKAYIGLVTMSSALWTDASPADTVTHTPALVSFSVSSLAGTTPVDFDGTDNSTLPIPNAAGLDPTDKFTFDMVSTDYSTSASVDTAMASDGSYYLVTGTQNTSTSPADMFTVGDWSGPSGSSYTPTIGKVSNTGVNSGPAHQPSCNNNSTFTDVYLSESVGEVYACGYSSSAGFFDPDGAGPSASLPLNPATVSGYKGMAAVYDTTTWAVKKAVVWESTQGNESCFDIVATPDGGFAVCGVTNGDMGGHTNPSPGQREGYIEKYNADGTLAWSHQTETSYYDYFRSMSLDEDGNLYVSGRQDEALGDQLDAVLWKFDTDGNVVWKSVIDNDGTNDEAYESSSLDKTKVYVTSHYNVSGGGTPWTNTISYVPSGNWEAMIQKLSPGDFNNDGLVDFTDVQMAGNNADGLSSGGVGVDTYDFDEDGKSDYVDARYMITNIMDRVLGDVHPGSTFDSPGDVDNADIGLAAGNFNGSTGSGKTYFQGDMDFDGDVDNADIGFVAGAFTGALAGNKTDGPGTADLVYDPATGNVKVDASEADGAKVISFQFENADGTFIPANYIGLTGGTFGIDTLYEDVTELVVADSDLAGIGFTGIHDFGNIFPTGMDLDQLEAYLTTALYTGGFGTSQKEIDLVVVPEPATMFLLGLGGLGMLARRRRKL